MNRLLLILLSLISVSVFAQESSLNNYTDLNTEDSYSLDFDLFHNRNPRQCRVDMMSINNNRIESFYGVNCQIARDKCELDLDRRHYNGRNPYARCIIASNGGDNYHPPGNHNPPGHRFTWQCEARDRGWEEHFGGHLGYGGTQTEAVRNSIRICRNSHGECYVTECKRF